MQDIWSEPAVQEGFDKIDAMKADPTIKEAVKVVYTRIVVDVAELREELSTVTRGVYNIQEMLKGAVGGLEAGRE
jgi:hypothetical protein